MTEKTDLLQAALDHPRIALIIALVLGGIALSGKFSVNASRILFLLAWVVAVFGFYGYFRPSWTIHKPMWMFAGSSIGFGVALLFLGAWAQPEAVPLNFGILTARRPLIVWSSKMPGRLIQVGDSGVFFNITPSVPEAAQAFGFIDGSGLTIERIGEKLKVSTRLRNSNGDLVAEIIRNEWKVSPVAWDRNYTDDALEVKDSRGKIVLQVKVLPDRIQLQGEWWNTLGQGFKLAKCVHPDGEHAACEVLMTPTYHPDEPIIEPMFEYPSELHFGELRH
jgi:hypothetical protein